MVCRLTDSGRYQGMASGDLFQNLGCLVLASVIVTFAARRFISSADTIGEHLLRAAVIPYLGCLVYISLSAGLIWLHTFLYPAD